MITKTGNIANKGDQSLRTRLTEDHVRQLGRLGAAHLAAERVRTSVLGPDLRWGPGWSMMLALYDAHSRDRPYSLKQLYDAAGVNNATAARWLGILVQRGLMLRTPDAVDGRKHWAILTELGVAAMEDCLLVESDLFNTALAGPGLSVSQNGPDTVRPKSVRRRD